MSTALDDLLRSMEEMKAMGPILGAVIAVRWWANTGATINVTVDALDDAGWKMLRDIVGEEGETLVRRHAGQKVLILSEHALRSLPTSAAPDPTALFGLRVYTLTTPPEPSLDFAFR